MDKITINTLRVYITIYHTYKSIYNKGHIRINTNDTTLNVVSRNSRVNKITKLHLIHLEFLHCNISHLHPIIV